MNNITTCPVIEISKAKEQIREALLIQSNDMIQNLELGSLIFIGDKTYRIVEDKDKP